MKNKSSVICEVTHTNRGSSTVFSFHKREDSPLALLWGGSQTMVEIAGAGKQKENQERFLSRWWILPNRRIQRCRPTFLAIQYIRNPENPFHSKIKKEGTPWTMDLQPGGQAASVPALPATTGDLLPSPIPSIAVDLWLCLLLPETWIAVD